MWLYVGVMQFHIRRWFEGGRIAHMPDTMKAAMFNLKASFMKYSHAPTGREMFRSTQKGIWGPRWMKVSQINPGTSWECHAIDGIPHKSPRLFVANSSSFEQAKQRLKVQTQQLEQYRKTDPSIDSYDCTSPKGKE